MMPLKNPKQMPFTKDDYFKMLDDMMTGTSMGGQPSGNPLIDRLRKAAQKQKLPFPRAEGPQV